MNNKEGYVCYDVDDDTYAGARHVVEKELAHLTGSRNTDKNNIKGLALSGGGIRSASFCLGVLQVLARHDKLQQFDYLSTVSGGGYLGGALSWLWSGKWRQGTDCTTEFGTGATNFPFGTGQRYSNTDDLEMDRQQASLMRHLRQHGKYLTPGNGIDAFSMLSVVLRSITMGFVTLIVLASFIFHFLYYSPVYKQGEYFNSYALDLSAYAISIYILLILSYGLIAIVLKPRPDYAYMLRRLWERRISIYFKIMLVIILLAIVHELKICLDDFAESTGGISALIGAIMAWYSQKSKGGNVLKIIPKSISVNIGVILMFVGLFVLSEQIAYFVFSKFNQPVFNVFSIAINNGFIVHGLLAAFIVLAAWLISINKVSIHRYYRDRLMETFMPDVCNVIAKAEPCRKKTAGSDGAASKANVASLSSCLSDESNDMPYHIINTNLILVESKISKFKGRGGDNFILSPLYSGSNATGWRETRQFANDSMTLPTAVAISGAAANSDSGVAGKGLTMSPFISAIMTIFNLRLGYWAVNPHPVYQDDQSANPNFFIPGFRGVLGRSELNERASFVQLSDGGHFENLALYELIRRRCKLIICCDAEQDNDFIFEGLSNLIEKARVDFGVEVKLNAEDLDKLKYTTTELGEIRYARQGYLIANIIYPSDSEEKPVGKLVYIKSTLPSYLPAELKGYRAMHPGFPHESTADQFFDEVQLEAYRMLGAHIADALIEDGSINW